MRKFDCERRKLKDRLSDWQDQYDCNQAGLLARTLIEGNPCACSVAQQYIRM